MASHFTEQPLPSWRRAVLKVGSSLLTTPDGRLDDHHAGSLAAFVSASRREGREVVIVSSGAVAAGRGLALPEKSTGLSGRQALAALSQTRLVALWQGFFDAPVAQVLLTHDDLRNRRRYLNARSTLRELLALGAIPVINENDTVAVDELKLGDNDNLAAIVAALVDADVLMIASDIAGLYTANPRTDPDAQPVPDVAEVTPDHLASAGGAGTAAGTGGMRTKLEAALKAAAAGIETLLFDGRDAVCVARMAEGHLTGTRLRAPRSRLAARKYWLRHALGAGRIVVDDGALQALRARRPPCCRAGYCTPKATSHAAMLSTSPMPTSPWPVASCNMQPRTSAASPAGTPVTSNPCLATAMARTWSIATTSFYWVTYEPGARGDHGHDLSLAYGSTGLP